MDILADLQELHDKWKSKSDEAGSKDYELTQWHDALHYCINSLGDVIIKHEKARQKDSEDVCSCGCEIGEFHREGCRWSGRGNLFNG